MTSILTNIGAISALQTLRSLSSSLDQAQRQVSSGMRIGQASDNAAYWSIATTMRSDNKAISAVSDALGLGAAKVDTAYAGMDATVEILSEFKAKLVAARESGVDRAKIQAELDQLKQGVVSIATSSSFGGQNWLSTDIAEIRTSPHSKTSVLASFIRDSAGGVSVATMGVDLSKISLFNTSGFGLLQTDFPVSATGPSGPSTPPSGGYSVQEYFHFSGPITLSSSDSINFDLVVHPGGSGPDVTVPTTITQADVNAALGVSTGTISDGNQMGKVLLHVWAGNSNVTTSAYGQTRPDGSVDWHTFIIHGLNVSDQPDSSVEINNLASTLAGGASGGLEGLSYHTYRNGTTTSAPPGGSSGTEDGLLMNFLDIDITSGIGGELDAIELMLKRTITAAATLGSLKKRIDMQTGFAAGLMGTIEKGVGRLVDADMNEASTRLKALQTQKQLAVQSLSIANANAENLLSLFR